MRNRAVTTAICQASGSTVPADRERALYATMLRQRRFEEKAGMLYALGTLATPCPLGYGQEAAIAALVDSLESADVLVCLPARPAVELALGTAPALVFQRLVPAADPGAGTRAIVRGPGDEWRLLNHQDALRAAKTARTGTSLFLAFDPYDLKAGLATADKVLAVVMIPSDRRPETWPVPPHAEVRECDGASVDAVSAALAAARDALSASQGPIVLAILTPPYAGHARDTGRRAARRDTPDPLSLYRQHLVSTGRLGDAEVTCLENAVRDEIAAAGRAMSLSCAP